MERRYTVLARDWIFEILGFERGKSSKMSSFVMDIVKSDLGPFDDIT